MPAMPDINKMINDPAVSDPALKDNKLDLENWSRKNGELAAKTEGIALTEGGFTFQLHHA